jgi:hypothetical protein
VPSLAPQLRAVGGFDQPYSAADVMGVEHLAATAASAVAPDLVGTLTLMPVAESATMATRPDALVVPLRSSSSQPGGQRIVGMVAFLRDCAGRVYYSSVSDLLSQGTATSMSFPAVSAAQAAGRLGTAAPRLVYADSPFSPEWLNPANGATISAISSP